MHQKMGMVDRMVRGVLGLGALVLLEGGLVSGTAAFVVVGGVPGVFAYGAASHLPGPGGGAQGRRQW